MAEKPLETVLQQIRQVVGAPAAEELPDLQLLQRFTQQREEAAFAALVRRHGPMVFGVCRRVLRDAHQAEDAFQATFLVLARKAGSIRKQESVASWLYGVAYRIAGKTRASAIRRSVLERRAMGTRQREEQSAPPPRPELEEALDQELHKLPEKYRAPLVLCYLQGKTNEEAAQQLGWTTGTVRGRLFRGRDLLRGRLVRRGLGMTSGVALTALMVESAHASVPNSLMDATIRAGMLYARGQTAAAGISSTAAGMAAGAMRGMAWEQLKSPVAVAAAAGLTGLAMFVGYGAMADHFRPELPPPGPHPESNRPVEPGAALNLAEVDVLKEITAPQTYRPGLLEGMVEIFGPLRAEATLTDDRGQLAADQEVSFRWSRGEVALRTDARGAVWFDLDPSRIENLRLVAPRNLTPRFRCVGEEGLEISFDKVDEKAPPDNAGDLAGFEQLNHQGIQVLFPPGREAVGKQALRDLVGMAQLCRQTAGLKLVTPCRLVLANDRQAAPSSLEGLQVLVPLKEYDAALSGADGVPAEQAQWLILHRWAQLSLTNDPNVLQEPEEQFAKSGLGEVLAHEYCRRFYPSVARRRLRCFEVQVASLLQRGKVTLDLRENFNEGSGALAFVYWRRAVDAAGPGYLGKLVAGVKRDPDAVLQNGAFQMDLAKCSAELRQWAENLGPSGR